MIVTVIGARPQFIKAAVVSKALIELGLDERIVHTGQHYDDQMSGVFFRELGIPAYEANLNVGSGSHAEQTAQMLVKIEQFLLSKGNHVKAVLLYGDTNSTIAGALAAAKLGVKIIHVESGLRSFNRSMPEEINRIVTDQLSDILFCPSEQAVNQLAKEGITTNVFDVGDVMFDALLQFKTKAADVTGIIGSNEPFNLLTIHRPSNTDDPKNLAAIFSAIEHVGTRVVWPIHPRTKKRLEDNKTVTPANLTIIDPLSYFEMIGALRNCVKVLTDSGGLQKEAYWMKKPCITLRTETEWIETLHSNWNILVGPDTAKIIDAVQHKVDPTTWTELYGDGKAATRIAKQIKELIY